MNQSDLLKEALKLDVRERAGMAHRLLESLDELSPAELEGVWTEEAQRRDEAMRQGRLESVPAAQVMAELKATLR